MLTYCSNVNSKYSLLEILPTSLLLLLVCPSPFLLHLSTFFSPLTGHNEADFSKHCHFPAVPLLCSSCSHPSLRVPNQVSPHVHFQGTFSSRETDCTLPPLLIASPSYRGKPPARKSTRHGIDGHVTMGIAKKLLPSQGSGGWRQQPPQCLPCRSSPSRDVPARSGRNRRPWKSRRQSCPRSPTSPCSTAVTDFGRVSSRQRAPSLICQLRRRGLPRRWSAKPKTMIFELP